MKTSKEALEIKIEGKELGGKLQDMAWRSEQDARALKAVRYNIPRSGSRASVGCRSVTGLLRISAE